MKNLTKRRGSVDIIDVLKCKCNWVGTEEDLIFLNDIIVCPSCKEEDNFETVINIKSDPSNIDKLIIKTIEILERV